MLLLYYCLHLPLIISKTSYQIIANIYIQLGIIRVPMVLRISLYFRYDLLQVHRKLSFAVNVFFAFERVTLIINNLDKL